MRRKQNLLRLVLNLIIAFFSSTWIIALFFSISPLFIFLQDVENKFFPSGEYPDHPSIAHTFVSQWFINIAFGLFFVTVFAWVFIVCCLIWPVSHKENSNL